MATRIPPLLEPYLSLPPETSLILLTNVLGASSNWLILRFLYSCINAKTDDETEENEVLLGLDLDKLATRNRFRFVDGLSKLFVPKQSQPSLPKLGEKLLSIPELDQISGEIQRSIQELKSGGKVLLVIDHLDLILAAGSNVGPVGLSEVLMDWRENTHATILSVAADLPLVAEQHTPLEIDHSSFLLSVAHEADLTMGLRLLDTGAARDVSGVVRISAREDFEGTYTKEEKELLYFVGGDGGVKVFERGQ